MARAIGGCTALELRQRMSCWEFRHWIDELGERPLGGVAVFGAVAPRAPAASNGAREIDDPREFVKVWNG